MLSGVKKNPSYIDGGLRNEANYSSHMYRMLDQNNKPEIVFKSYEGIYNFNFN